MANGKCTRDMFLELVKNNDIETMSEGIKKGWNITFDNNWLLTMACLEGNAEMVELLLNEGADVNSENNNILIYAVENEEVDCVKLILEKRNYDEEILEELIKTTKNFEIYKLLLYYY